MTAKPQRKREVALISTSTYPSGLRSISFCASPEAAQEVGEFGTLSTWDSVKDCYQLTVDPRFDFDEVVRFIEEYDSQEPLDFLEENGGPPQNV
jgi:hypothetical protein